jgi:ABC-type uncharacterized transport system substrate-binding protein
LRIRLRPHYPLRPDQQSALRELFSKLCSRARGTRVGQYAVRVASRNGPCLHHPNGVAACRQRSEVLLVSPSSFFSNQRTQITALAAQRRVPALYFERDFAHAGGLMSYGPNIPEFYRQLGNYAGRILSGQKPGDLPVSRATRLEFVINLKTAKTLGLTIPQTLLATADEVIQ